MGRPTKDDRRHDYLDIGASIVADAGAASGDGAGLALAHVRLAEVAERAGVTKGALYHIWPSQEAFWSDLLDHLWRSTAWSAWSGSRRSSPRSRRTPTNPLGLPGYLNAIFECFRDDPSFFTRISLYAYLNDDATRRALDRQFRESLATPASSSSGVGLDGLRPDARPGWTSTTSMIAAIALLEGLCLEYRVDPDEPGRRQIDGRRWTTFALGADALIRGYTEPTTSGRRGVGSRP